MGFINASIQTLFASTKFFKIKMFLGKIPKVFFNTKNTKIIRTHDVDFQKIGHNSDIQHLSIELSHDT